MKTFKFLPILLLFILTSCSSVYVNTDYDKNVDFTQFKTYAYYKNGIDKVKISDFDKKRILRSIDQVMEAKGFTKNETPDILINFYTKAEKEINITPYYSGYGWGWGYGWGYGYPYWGGSYTYTSIEGVLTIDIIDTKKNELLWQGTGVGNLTQNADEKEAVINGFVTQILAQFPPIPKTDKTKKPQ
jgi:hypothetical protein